MDGADTIGLAALVVAYFSIAFYSIEMRRLQLPFTLVASLTGGIAAFVLARELARSLS